MTRKEYVPTPESVLASCDLYPDACRVCAKEAIEVAREEGRRQVAEEVTKIGHCPACGHACPPKDAK